MNIKLSEITQIISGFSFRSAMKTVEQGTHFVVQAHDIYINNQTIDVHKLDIITFNSKSKDPLLKDGDILLSARGTETNGFKAAIYFGKEFTVVASSSLYILRLKDSRIIPEYLLYYINSSRGQKTLRNIMMGSTVKTISKKDLLELSIPIPPIEKQKIIVDTMTNMIRQKILLKKKIQLLNTLTYNINSSIKLYDKNKSTRS